jgi:hypothetical protein
MYSTESVSEKIIKTIARNYNPLEMTEGLTQLLLPAYPEGIIANLSKRQLHELVNDLIVNRHNGEQVLKYYLFRYFLKKNVVAAFEMRVDKSRVDFLAINGDSKSFEIKSKLDNLNKLKKQASDYVRAFEYNYLIIDIMHLQHVYDLVPETFGIWSFNAIGKKKIHRKAVFNPKIDAEAQLKLLTQRERQAAFKGYKGEINQITKDFRESFINENFKIALKRRYQKRWDFLIENEKAIFPLDLQFFFNRNIDPKVIYC